MNAMTTANTTSQHMRSVDLDQFTGTVSKDMKQWARDRQALFAPLLLPIVLMFIATVLFADCRAKHPRNAKARQECDQPNRRVEIILHGEKAE